MTSEIRGSQTGNTDFSIARILANECPNAASLRKRRESSQERGDHPRQSTGDRERKGHAGQPEERLEERETPNETYRDVPVVDRDDGSTIRQTDLTWLQYTRYRPPRLPRRSFTEKRVKRHVGDHPRIPFSSSQLQVLEDRYRKSAYLSKNDVVEMSATLRLPQSKQNVVEPMQVDAPTEDNDNAEEEPYIVENPTLDLEVYANSYTGLAKLHRLIYIADHCPSLRIEALKMAITYVMTTYNVALYILLHKKLVEAMGYTPGLPDIAAQSTSQDMPTMDQTWVETRSKKAALKLEKFDTDLKNYKSNSIKESIRRGHDDLGDHYLNCGDLVHALKCYSRARDYCTSGKHVVNMCLNVIKVSVYLQNWSHVLSYVTKAESTPDFPELHGKDNNQAIVTKLKVAAGLAELATRKYKMAAKHFLQASLDHCDCPELLSPGNVALYGGLCALATFDRHELQKQVIFSSSFKLFLELEPQLRDIIFKFYESKYASCLKLLDEIKDNILLDMYIAPHVNLLYTQIRNRALIQYFSPYLSADMRRMATAFNRTVSELEDELMQLILDGQIQARIDSHNKILYAKDVDQRSTTFEKSMSVGKDYQRRTRMLILRAAMLKQQIHVKSPQRDSTQGGEMSVAPGNGTLAAKN